MSEYVFENPLITSCILQFLDNASYYNAIRVCSSFNSSAPKDIIGRVQAHVNENPYATIRMIYARKFASLLYLKNIGYKFTSWELALMRNRVPGFHGCDANGYYVSPFITPNIWQIGCVDFNVKIYIDRKTYPKLIDKKHFNIMIMSRDQTVTYVNNKPFMQIPTLSPRATAPHVTFAYSLTKQYTFELITEFLHELTGRICSV